MCPLAAAADREGRRAIPAHRHASDILEQALAEAYVGSKRFGGLLIDPGMVGSVARQLMPFRNNAAHQRRVPLRHPTERKERRFRFCFGEDVEQASGIALNAPRKALPLGAPYGRCERFDLEIILDVDRQRMRNSGAGLGLKGGRVSRVRTAGSSRSVHGRSLWK